MYLKANSYLIPVHKKYMHFFHIISHSKGRKFAFKMFFRGWVKFSCLQLFNFNCEQLHVNVLSFIIQPSLQQSVTSHPLRKPTRHTSWENASHMPSSFWEVSLAGKLQRAEKADTETKHHLSISKQSSKAPSREMRKEFSESLRVR